MRDNLPYIEELKNDQMGKALLEAYYYWSKRRIIFNLIVGVIGLLSTFSFAKIFTIFDLWGIFMWGIVANGLYSFGYALDSYFIARQSKINFYKYRNWFFWTGTILTLLLVLFSLTFTI